MHVEESGQELTLRHSHICTTDNYIRRELYTKKKVFYVFLAFTIYY